MGDGVKLLRAVDAFRKQAVKAWDFLHSLAQYTGYGVDNLATLDVEGKELPINPSEFELSWLRVCEAMISLSDIYFEDWHDNVEEVYKYVCGVNRCVDGYKPIPTEIQIAEADDRFAGLGELAMVCWGLESVATFDNNLYSVTLWKLYKNEAERIRAYYKAREDEELYREVASELLASQCTAGATLEQASAPEVAGLQARIKELEQALKASEAKCKEQAEQLARIPPADSVWLVSSSSDYQAKLAGALCIAVKYGIIVKGAGAYQYATKEGCSKELLACYLSDVSQKLNLSNRGGTNWAVWKRSIQGIPKNIRTKVRTDYNVSYIVKDTLDEIRKELNALK